LVILGALGLAFVAGASYIRRKTSNLMQCSVCGALIPADSLKCPRCGAEFEKDMVKCSECSSWIPEIQSTARIAVQFSLAKKILNTRFL